MPALFDGIHLMAVFTDSCLGFGVSSVNSIMTLFTQGLTVTDFKPEFWKVNPGLYMVCNQLAAANVAILAGIIIPGKYGLTPQFVVVLTGTLFSFGAICALVKRMLFAWFEIYLLLPFLRLGTALYAIKDVLPLFWIAPGLLGIIACLLTAMDRSISTIPRAKLHLGTRRVSKFFATIKAVRYRGWVFAFDGAKSTLAPLVHTRGDFKYLAAPFAYFLYPFHPIPGFLLAGRMATLGRTILSAVKFERFCLCLKCLSAPFTGSSNVFCHSCLKSGGPRRRRLCCLGKTHLALVAHKIKNPPGWVNLPRQWNYSTNER